VEGAQVERSAPVRRLKRQADDAALRYRAHTGRRLCKLGRRVCQRERKTKESTCVGSFSFNCCFGFFVVVGLNCCFAVKQDEELFQRDFARAWSKLMELGVEYNPKPVFQKLFG
jgi:hypothetical protein